MQDAGTRPHEKMGVFRVAALPQDVLGDAATGWFEQFVETQLGQADDDADSEITGNGKADVVSFFHDHDLATVGVLLSSAIGDAWSGDFFHRASR